MKQYSVIDCGIWLGCLHRSGPAAPPTSIFHLHRHSRLLSAVIASPIDLRIECFSSRDATSSCGVPRNQRVSRRMSRSPFRTESSLRKPKHPSAAALSVRASVAQRRGPRSHMTSDDVQQVPSAFGHRPSKSSIAAGQPFATNLPSLDMLMESMMCKLLTVIVRLGRLQETLRADVVAATRAKHAVIV